MKDFRYGTLMLIPEGPLFHTAHKLREIYDPLSAKTSPPHLTVTQPFSQPLDAEAEKRITDLLLNIAGFKVQIGPATTSPNQQLIWLDVSPKEPVLEIRELLHETGLFRTDLPLTKGFIPHLTVSEARRNPNEVKTILDQLNKEHSPLEVNFKSLVCSVPDNDFVFNEIKVFKLKTL